MILEITQQDIDKAAEWQSINDKREICTNCIIAQAAKRAFPNKSVYVGICSLLIGTDIYEAFNFYEYKKFRNITLKEPRAWSQFKPCIIELKNSEAKRY